MFGIAITATLASELFGRTAGLFAALLLATLPNDILSSTRILADAPLGAWTSGAILALLIGWNSGHLASFALCGLMLGIAYLVKDTGLVVFVLLAPLVLAYAMVTRRWRLLGGYLTGFLLCIVLEGLWYQFHTGHFFLHPLVAHSVTVHKYTKEPVASLVTLPFLRVDWVEQFFLIGPVLFGFAKETPYRFSGFGVTYWLIGAGFVWCASRSSDRRVQVLLALVAVIYLYLEFGPVGVTLEDGVLVYRGIYKHLRYASVLTPLAMPFAGLVLALLWARHRGVAIAATVAVIASGVPSLLHDYTVLRASQHDLRVAATFLTPLNATVYTDYLAAGSLRYHSGNHAGGMRIRDIREIQNPSDLRDSFVVLGGSRGIEVLSEYALQVIPSWARSISERPESALPTWHRLLTLEGPKDDRRRYDMVIFKVE
jgi:4-amino-4-deoxy-L-arabinose transferase-like glycosyltransferase